MTAQKVLIVDDEIDFVTIVKFFLEKKGYQVIAAFNEADALKHAEETPDIILLDIMMPGTDGFNLLHKLHINSTTQRIPIIMLSAIADTHSLFKAQELGASDYIIKTESLDRILAIVKKNLVLYKNEPAHLSQHEKPRKSGINVLDDLTWGKHICAFYGSREDLLSMLTPFFKAGLLDNELCFWMLSEGLRVEDAKIALSKEIENVNTYIAKGQLQIIAGKDIHEDWRGFNQEKLINFWIQKEKDALAQGFNGLRASGSGNWAFGPKWQDQCNYEKHVNAIISTRKIIALCTYSIYKCDLLEIIAVGIHHTVIIAKQMNNVVSFAPTSQESFRKYFDTTGRMLKLHS
jgi:CheY-like chemotaxis protein